MKPYRIFLSLIVLALVLSACTLPSATPTEQTSPDAVFTAAAQTVEVQLTQNALLLPTNLPATIAPPPVEATKTPESPVIEPTKEPTVTNKPVVVPTSSCDAAQFINDITIPDGTVFTGGATFTKTWRLKNVGTCTWNSSYNLVFDSGESMGGAASQPLSGTVAPNESIDISINLQAPAKQGTLRGYWGLSNASGTRIPVAGGTSGKSFYVEIKVSESGNTVTPGPSPTLGASATPSPSPTTGASATPGPSPTASASATPSSFSITGVSFAAARFGACDSDTGKYVVDAYLQSNNSGTVYFTWIRSDGATGPEYSSSILFDSAGTQKISYEWTTKATGLWMDLYIDKPNNKQFGRIALVCP